MQAVELGFEEVVALSSGKWALEQVAGDMEARGLVASAHELRVQANVLARLAQRPHEVPG